MCRLLSLPYKTRGYFTRGSLRLVRGKLSLPYKTRGYFTSARPLGTICCVIATLQNKRVFYPAVIITAAIARYRYPTKQEGILRKRDFARRQYRYRYPTKQEGILLVEGYALVNIRYRYPTKQEGILPGYAACL